MSETAILLVMAPFLLAGTVKGVIGLGLPTVSLAILTVAIDLPNAMALAKHERGILLIIGLSLDRETCRLHSTAAILDEIIRLPIVECEYDD